MTPGSSEVTWVLTRRRSQKLSGREGGQGARENKGEDWKGTWGRFPSWRGFDLGCSRSQERERSYNGRALVPSQREGDLQISTTIKAREKRTRGTPFKKKKRKNLGGSLKKGLIGKVGASGVSNRERTAEDIETEKPFASARLGISEKGKKESCY